MRLLLGILFLPLIYFYGDAFVSLLSAISLQHAYQVNFWLAFGISTILLFVFLGRDAYLAIFEHEFTHNSWAILTFNRPKGFHVERGNGGYFEYSGRGNFLITLSPYFFLTLSFILLIFYNLIKPEYYSYFYIVLGIFTGYHTSSTIKETSFNQPDIKANGFFFHSLPSFWVTLFSMG
jgi:hypothetical protein